jgi:hypothetical protein
VRVRKPGRHGRGATAPRARPRYVFKKGPPPPAGDPAAAVPLPLLDELRAEFEYWCANHTTFSELQVLVHEFARNFYFGLCFSCDYLNTFLSPGSFSVSVSAVAATRRAPRPTPRDHDAPTERLG